MTRRPIRASGSGRSANRGGHSVLNSKGASVPVNYRLLSLPLYMASESRRLLKEALTHGRFISRHQNHKHKTTFSLTGWPPALTHNFLIQCQCSFSHSSLLRCDKRPAHSQRSNPRRRAPTGYLNLRPRYSGTTTQTRRTNRSKYDTGSAASTIRLPEKGFS